MSKERNTKNSQQEFYKNTAEENPDFINRTYRLAFKNAEYLDQFVLQLQLTHKTKISRNEIVNAFIEILEEKMEDRNGDLSKIKSIEDIKNLFFK
jgi:hypothetical protein